MQNLLKYLALTHTSDTIPINPERTWTNVTNPFTCVILIKRYVQSHIRRVRLFNDNNSQVKTFCDFRFLPNLISPDVFELTDTSVWVYNTQTLYLDCPRSHKTFPGCQLCALDILRNCSLQTYKVWPARICFLNRLTYYFQTLICKYMFADRLIYDEKVAKKALYQIVSGNHHWY